MSYFSLHMPCHVKFVRLSLLWHISYVLFNIFNSTYIACLKLFIVFTFWYLNTFSLVIMCLIELVFLIFLIRLNTWALQKMRTDLRVQDLVITIRKVGQGLMDAGEDEGWSDGSCRRLCLKNWSLKLYHNKKNENLLNFGP